MAFVIIALLPCLFFGIWNIGDQYHLAKNIQASFLDNMTFGFWKFLIKISAGAMNVTRCVVTGRRTLLLH